MMMVVLVEQKLNEGEKTLFNKRIIACNINNTEQNKSMTP
jgi:hypothetical protein